MLKKQQALHKKNNALDKSNYRPKYMDVHFVEWALEVNIICEIIWNRITVQMYCGFYAILTVNSFH